MKATFTLLISLITINIFSQNNKLNGVWILDKFVYSDGRPLEINDNNFSSFSKYEFDNNKMKIQGLEIPITTTSNTIQTNAAKYEYGFDNKYLLLKMQGDEKIACLLKPEKFIELYPEFQLEKIKYNDSDVYKENLIVSPEFTYQGGFNSYLLNTFAQSENYEVANYYFDIQFILTKDSKIKDIKILKGSGDFFEKKVIQTINNSEKYFKNTTGKDFLMNRKFKMNTVESSNQMSKVDKQIAKIHENGLKYYMKDDFPNAIKTYEALDLITAANSENQLIKSSYKNLGISYLAINEIGKACNSFKKSGSRTDFEIRNYLINFCSKK